MGLGPFDLTGGPFLALYGVLLVMAGIVSLLMPHWTRPEGRPGRIEGIDELAHLAGGTVRMAESAMVRLLAAQTIVQEGKDQFRTRDPNGGTTQVERSILSMAHPARWNEILKHLADYGRIVERGLASKGLSMEPGEVWQQRCANAAPLVLLFLFGAGKFMIGQARDKPIGFLGALLVLTGLLAIMRFVDIDRRTRAGHALLSLEGERADRIRRAPAREEMGTAVALFGTWVLAESALTDFHRMRRDGDSGGDGSGGDGDGGGCGGGGCGGCGG